MRGSTRASGTTEMSVDSSLIDAAAAAPPASRVGWLDQAWAFARAKPLGADGALIALFVGFAASFAGCSIGGLLGVLSAYCGGTVDLLLERVMDVLLAFPQLILALAVASILGPAVPNVVIAVAIPIIPRAARVVRATALSIKENQYVEAVSALGASRRRVVFQHILPNVVAPYIIMVTA